MKIEKVFVISLPERLNDRLYFLSKRLVEEGIEFEVVEAIRSDNGVDGLAKTFHKLFTSCVDKGYRNVLVLEDDCEFIVDKPFELIGKCMMQLPFNFDLLYCGCNLFQTNVSLSSANLIQVLGAWALHAVVYSAIGMRKVLKAIETRTIGIPLDSVIVDKVQSDGLSFCSYPMIATQKNGFSDIMKAEVNYDRFLLNRFIERTKKLSGNA